MSEKHFDLLEKRLTTAEIFYFYPDHPLLIQSYVWQDLDMVPQFPILREFVEFWDRELEGRIHSVDVTASDIAQTAHFTYTNHELILH